MKFLLRTLAALLAAMWLAAPSVSSEGGENAGGTGVWILPCSSPIGPSATMGATSASRQLSSFASDLTMTVSVELGNVVATAIDPTSSAIVPLTVSGRDVTLRGSTMRAFRDAQLESVEILIVDQSQLGYRITFRIASNGQGGSLTIH